MRVFQRGKIGGAWECFREGGRGTFFFLKKKFYCTFTIVDQWHSSPSWVPPFVYAFTSPCDFRRMHHLKHVKITYALCIVSLLLFGFYLILTFNQWTQLFLSLSYFDQVGDKGPKSRSFVLSAWFSMWVWYSVDIFYATWLTMTIKENLLEEGSVYYRCVY